MDSKPRAASQRRRKLREPNNLVLGIQPEDFHMSSEEEMSEITIKFFLSKDINCLRWMYCWAGSPVQHVQVCIDGLLNNVDTKIPSHWMCEKLYANDSPGGSYEIAKELVFKVPNSLVNWDRIRAVSEGFRISVWRTVLWGLIRHKEKRNIPKPSPDCVSVSKQILGTLGIYTSGETPWELYECLINNYKPEEKSYRSFM